MRGVCGEEGDRSVTGGTCSASDFPLQAAMARSRRRPGRDDGGELAVGHVDVSFMPAALRITMPESRPPARNCGPEGRQSRRRGSAQPGQFLQRPQLVVRLLAEQLRRLRRHLILSRMTRDQRSMFATEPGLLGRHHAAHRDHTRHGRPRSAGLLGRHVMTTRISRPPLSLDAIPHSLPSDRATGSLVSPACWTMAPTVKILANHRLTTDCVASASPISIATSPQSPQRPVYRRVREAVCKQSP
jgi:hypothetical protein